ncbi:hypothetical protein ACOMHN_006417 [Nucella lapillus]
MTEPNIQHLPLRKTAMALIKELGSESNAHGVARIIRSRDKRRKVVWSLLVLFGVGSAISQLSSLVHKYLQYQVVEVSEIQDGLPVEFPAVTLCNIEPISWRKLRRLLNGTTPETTEVRAWLHFLETFDFGEQHAHLRSIRAFHENVAEGVVHVQHSLNESLLHCRFNKRPCSTANFTTSFDGNYYSCFTFNAQEAVGAGSDVEGEGVEEEEEEEKKRKKLIVHSTGPEHGLSVVMFLDNNFPPLGSYGVYSLEASILHSAGARVMVHAPHTLPLPVQHGHDVAPGYSTSVGVKPLLHARLAQPYGNCSDSKLRGLSRFTSTYSTCIAICKQKLIVRECRCRSSALPQIPDLGHVPYCGYVPKWRHMLRHAHQYNRSQHLPRLHCELRALERVKNDRGYEVECRCNHPCGELSYQMSTSMSYWPTELYQYHALRQLYKDTILQSPLSRAYRLHHTNIKQGEEILRQLSQQEPATDTLEEEDDKEEEPSPQSSDGDSWNKMDYADSRRSSEIRKSSTASFDSSNRSETRGEYDEHPSRSEDVFNDIKSNQTKNDSSESARASRKPSQTNRKRKRRRKEGKTHQPMLEYNNQQLDNLREASTDIRQNLLRLNVYLEDLSVVKYKQMPAYGMEDLFADIGGTLGLWMGVSVLTIMELLELVFRLSHLFFKAEWRPTAMDSDGGRPSSIRSSSIISSSFRTTANTDGGEVWELRTCSRNCKESSVKHGRSRSCGDRDWRSRDCSFPELAAEHDREKFSYKDVQSEEYRYNFSNGYSYRSEADFYGSDKAHVPRDLFDMNGHSVRDFDPGSSRDPTPRPSRTSYWRLKRAKRKS